VSGRDSRSAPLRNLGPQVDLAADRAAGIEHVANLQQGQLGHPDAGGKRQEPQHHVTSCSGLHQVTDATRIKWRN